MKCFSHRDHSGYRAFLFKENDELAEEILQQIAEVIYSPEPTPEKMEQAVRKIVPDANKVEAELNKYGVAWQIKVT